MEFVVSHIICGCCRYYAIVFWHVQQSALNNKL